LGLLLSFYLVVDKMTLQEKRVAEMFHIFGQILTYGENQTFNLQGTPIPIKEVVPAIMSELSKIAIRNEEKFEGLADWMVEAIFYMKGDSDELPKMEVV
jgi:hypothetical protein